MWFILLIVVLLSSAPKGLLASGSNWQEPLTPEQICAEKGETWKYAAEECVELTFQQLEDSCRRKGLNWHWDVQIEGCMGLVMFDPADSISSVNASTPWSIEERDNRVYFTASPNGPYQANITTFMRLPTVKTVEKGDYVLRIATKFELAPGSSLELYFLNRNMPRYHSKRLILNNLFWHDQDFTISVKDIDELKLTFRFKAKGNNSQSDGVGIDNIRLYATVPLVCAVKGPTYKWNGSECLPLDSKDKQTLCHQASKKWVEGACKEFDLLEKQEKCQAKPDFMVWEANKCRPLSITELKANCKSPKEFLGNRCRLPTRSELKARCDRLPKWKYSWLHDRCRLLPIATQELNCKKLGSAFIWEADHCRALSLAEQKENCVNSSEYHFWIGGKCRINTKDCINRDFGGQWVFNGQECKAYSNFTDMCDDKAVSPLFAKTIASIMKQFSATDCANLNATLNKRSPEAGLRLNFSRQAVSLQPLLLIPQLTELFISNTSTEDTTPLSHLGSVEILRMDDNLFLDLSNLTNMKSLTLLSIIGSEVAGLESLCKNSKLERLYLDAKYKNTIASKLRQCLGKEGILYFAKQQVANYK